MKETFTQYVAHIYPTDTAVVEGYHEEGMIEMYPDLYEAYCGGFKDLREHDLHYIKGENDVRDYLDTVLHEDETLSDIQNSLELLLKRIKEIRGEVI